MGQSKFAEASGFNDLKDKAIGQAKGSPGGAMFFGGLGKGTISPKQNDSKEFAGEEQGQLQGKGKGPMRMAGLFGGLFGRGKGKKRFGLF